MKKRMMAFLAALLLLFLCGTSAAAETAGERFTVPDTYFSFAVPEGAAFVHPDLASNDPAWAAANILDVSEARSEMVENGMAGEIHLENGRVIAVTKKRSANFSEYVFNLSDADEELRAQVLERLAPNNESESGGGTIRWVDHPQTPFFCIDVFSDIAGLSGDDVSRVYERLYGTIVNGDLIAFDLAPTEETVSDELDAVLQALVASTQISEFLPRPAFELEPGAVFLLLFIAGLIVFVAAFFIWRSVSRRREKQEKADMASQLLAYRRAKAGREDEGDGPLRFQNATEHSEAAVNTFAKYHAMRHGILMPIFTILLAVCALAAVFVLQSTDSWWLTILLVGCIAYFTYHVFYAPTALAKTLNRVYSKFRNRTNTYYFYEGDFRVTGMQSSSLHPYFQITRFVESGNYFYLYFGPDNAYYIEKDSFSLGDADAFRAFMKEKLGKKAKVRAAAEGSVKA